MNSRFCEIPALGWLLQRHRRDRSWIHEIKHDGYRLLVRKQEGQVRI